MRLVNMLGTPIRVNDLRLLIPAEGLILSLSARKVAQSSIKDLIQNGALKIQLSQAETADPNAYMLCILSSRNVIVDTSPRRNPARTFAREPMVATVTKPVHDEVVALQNPVLDSPKVHSPNASFKFDQLTPRQKELLTDRVQSLDRVDLATIRRELKSSSATLLSSFLSTRSTNIEQLPISVIVEEALRIRESARVIGEYNGFDVGVFSMGGLGDEIVRASVIYHLCNSYKWPNVFITYYHHNSGRFLSQLDFIGMEVPLGSRNFSSDSAEVEKYGKHDIFVDLRYVGKITVEPSVSAKGVASGSAWKKTWGDAFYNHPTRIKEVITKWNLHYHETLAKSLGVVAPILDLQFPLPRHIQIDLPSKPFIVVSNGTDQTLESHTQTKQLDFENLNTLCSLLMARGWSIVEVGLPSVNRLSHFSIYNMVGKTNFFELCIVLKRASAVICNEGGIAHLATLLKVPTLVGFGPTSRTFWGYSQNENVCSEVCTDCWLTDPNWYLFCPRKNYVCMKALTADMMLSGFDRLCARYGIICR